MQTLLLQVDAFKPDPRTIKKAAEIIRGGGLVAFPTETVYGLGADAFSPGAVEKIFQVKGRPRLDPIIVHIAERETISLLVKEIPEVAWELMGRFWPGPLTLILLKSKRVPDIVTAGLPTVAVRMPKNQVALELIREAGVPIAAPSANLFSRPSPTTAQHVFKDLRGKIPLILDAGPTEIGVESTVLDITTNTPTILRPGGVSRESLQEILGQVAVTTQPKGDRPKSPGLMVKHYAPEARVLLFVGENPINKMKKEIQRLKSQGKRIGIMVPEEYLSQFKDEDVLVESLGSNLKEMAGNLFSCMRRMDERGVDFILTLNVSQTGLGLAVFDRLFKAAGSEVIR